MLLHEPPPSTLTLEFLLQLVEKPPVRALRDDLLRARLDHSSLAQAQGIESDRVLGIVLAPFAVGNVLHRLVGVVVTLREPSVDNGARNALGLERTDLIRFEDCSQSALC